jgi:hypothetical protein
MLSEPIVVTLQVTGVLETLQIPYFASPEDNILAKLEWYQRGGGISDRQWRDILSVIQVQGARLNRSYLEQWAVELGVDVLLEQAFTESLG